MYAVKGEEGGSNRIGNAKISGSEACLASNSDSMHRPIRGRVKKIGFSLCKKVGVGSLLAEKHAKNKLKRQRTGAMGNEPNQPGKMFR
jgi:hypothetical protein